MTDGGKYLKCDSCGKTWHGDPYDHKGNYNQRGHKHDWRSLLAEAEAKGWAVTWDRPARYPDEGLDYCPQCRSTGPGGSFEYFGTEGYHCIGGKQ